MASDGVESTPTEIVSPAPAPSAEPPPGQPGRAHRAARPARSVSRTWWILPYCAGALAVFVVAGLVIGLRSTAGAAAPSASSTPLMPAEQFPDTLFGQLTTDIQAQNESAFLGLASAAARPALTLWWDNLRAIGFTTGAVIPTASLDAVHIDSHGNGSTVVLAGVHSSFDPVDLDGKSQIPMAHYRIGLHFASPAATGQITSWQPLDGTPWDSPLYIKKDAHVVVAGPPGDSALVDQTLPAAETAAAYDVQMMHHVTPGFLLQQGFEVFVSGSATVRDGWLATLPQPQGWPPEFGGVRPVQLPGPGVTEDNAVARGQSTLVNAISDDSMGGVRVVLAPAAPATAGTLHDETVTLVREFMLDIAAPSNFEEPANGVPLKPVLSWTQVGLAVAAQSLFEANPNPVPSGKYDWATLTAELHGLPRSYKSGALPTDQQLFGPSLATDEDWGYVAASAYEYIDSRYNMAKMMVSGLVLQNGRPTPFGNVFKSGSNANNLVFYGVHSIGVFGWRPWLAHI
jgi:hypothetical protein